MILDKNGLPISDRTRKTEARYQADKEAGLTKNLLDEPAIGKLGEHWSLKGNAYPYDEKWRASDLIVYYKECEWADIPEAHLIELMYLEMNLMNSYDRIVLNGSRMASVKNIPHIHLLRGPVEAYA